MFEAYICTHNKTLHDCWWCMTFSWYHWCQMMLRSSEQKHAASSPLTMISSFLDPSCHHIHAHSFYSCMRTYCPIKQAALQQPLNAQSSLIATQKYSRRHTQTWVNLSVCQIGRCHWCLLGAVVDLKGLRVWKQQQTLSLSLFGPYSLRLIQ